jgi:hypothetical protein
VFEGVNVADAVGMNVDVAVGGTVVAVGINVLDGVAVGKSGIIVTPGTGVRVGTFGTQSN